MSGASHHESFGHNCEVGHRCGREAVALDVLPKLRSDTSGWDSHRKQQKAKVVSSSSSQRSGQAARAKHAEITSEACTRMSVGGTIAQGLHHNFEEYGGPSLRATWSWAFTKSGPAAMQASSDTELVGISLNMGGSMLEKRCPKNAEHGRQHASPISAACCCISAVVTFAFVVPCLREVTQKR